MNSTDKRIEETLNKGGQTISDLPKDYSDEMCMRAYAFVQSFRSENKLSVWHECLKYILHLTDVIDRLENALENQVTLHENLMHVIGNADIPDGVSYDQFCLVVDSIYKAVQTAQEGWENYEDGVAKRFDMHFYGEDCWYECEKYERWKEQHDDTDSEDSEIHDGRGQHHSDGCHP